MEIASSVLSAEFSRLGHQLLDAMEGGNKRETIAAVAKAGESIAVAGSAVFSHEAPLSMNRKSLHPTAAG